MSTIIKSVLLLEEIHRSKHAITFGRALQYTPTSIGCVCSIVG